MKTLLRHLAGFWNYYIKRKHEITYDVLIGGKLVQRRKRVSDWYIMHDTGRRHSR